jgi:hypothetical protein
VRRNPCALHVPGNVDQAIDYDNCAAASSMQENIEEVCGSPHGIKVLLSLLLDGEKHLPPHAITLLHPPSHTITVTQATSAADEGADDVKELADEAVEGETAQVEVVLGASKKEAAIRRQELLGSGEGSLAAALLQHCTSVVSCLLRSSHGAELVEEFACGSAGGRSLWEWSKDGVATLHAAVAAALRESLERGSRHMEGVEEVAGPELASEAPGPLIDDFFASRALRRMVRAVGCNEEAAGALRAALWHGALKGHCDQIVEGHGAKVLAGLLETAEGELRGEVEHELKSCSAVGNLDAWQLRFRRKDGGGQRAKEARSKCSKRK